MSRVAVCLFVQALDCTFALEQSRLMFDGISVLCDTVCALLTTESDLVAQPRATHSKSRETYPEA